MTRGETYSADDMAKTYGMGFRSGGLAGFLFCVFVLLMVSPVLLAHQSCDQSATLRSLHSRDAGEDR